LSSRGLLGNWGVSAYILENGTNCPEKVLENGTNVSAYNQNLKNFR
jgi:hypothetical protein